MQKMILVYESNFNELEKLLNEGWTVKDMKPVSGRENGFRDCYCYVLLEKE